MNVAPGVTRKGKILDKEVDSNNKIVTALRVQDPLKEAESFWVVL